MRLKPWLVTAAVAVTASAALGVVVTANDPASASAGVKTLFWASLGVAGWGAFATFLLAARGGLAQAVWAALALIVGGIGCIALQRAGARDPRLLGAVVFGTLSIAFAAWRRFRHA